MNLDFQQVTTTGTGTDVESVIARALGNVTRQHALGHGKAAVYHAAILLEALAEHYDVHGYAVV